MRKRKLLQKILIFTILTFVFSTCFISFAQENGHFLEFGQEVKATTVLETEGWTLVEESKGYMHEDRTTVSFGYSDTGAYARIICPITGGPNGIFMEFNDLDYSAYEYWFVITNSAYIVDEVFWSYKADFNSYGASSPEFQYGSGDFSWNEYKFRFYKKLKNQAPTITSITQGNETFSAIFDCTKEVA